MLGFDFDDACVVTSNCCREKCQNEPIRQAKEKKGKDCIVYSILRREKSFGNFFREVFAKFFKVFASFLRFSRAFRGFRIHSDPLGCIRMHSEAIGSIWMFSIFFEIFWILRRFSPFPDVIFTKDFFHGTI